MKIISHCLSLFLLSTILSCNNDDVYNGSVDPRLDNHTLIFKYHQDGLINPLFGIDSIDILDFKDRKVFRYKGYQNDTIQLIQRYSIVYQNANTEYVHIRLVPTLILDDYSLNFDCHFGFNSDQISSYVTFAGSKRINNCTYEGHEDCVGIFYYLDETDLGKYYIKNN